MIWIKRCPFFEDLQLLLIISFESSDFNNRRSERLLCTDISSLRKKGRIFVTQDEVTTRLSIISQGAPLTNHSLPNTSWISTTTAAYGAAFNAMTHQEASKNNQFVILGEFEFLFKIIQQTRQRGNFRAATCANHLQYRLCLLHHLY